MIKRQMTFQKITLTSLLNYLNLFQNIYTSSVVEGIQRLKRYIYVSENLNDDVLRVEKSILYRLK